jgi:serine/threonine protein kinase
LLPAEALADPQRLERFRREVRAAARLTHPNIVAAFDAGVSEARQFLIMELIDGMGLKVDGGHTTAEYAQLPSFQVQAKRTAVLLSRLADGAAGR